MITSTTSSAKPRLHGRTVPHGVNVLRAISHERQRLIKAKKSGKPTWKREIETVTGRLDSALHNRKHELYRAIAETRDTDRNIRSDGLTNMNSVLHVLVRHAIAGAWMIGEPEAQAAGITIYSRWSVEDLDQRAFGAEVPMHRSVKRTWRALAAFRAAGILLSFPQAREEVMLEDGSVRLHTPVAFRFLTVEFFAMLGLSYLVKAGAKRADRAKGEEREQRIGQHRGQASELRVPLEPGESLDDAPVLPTGPPPWPIQAERYSNAALESTLNTIDLLRNVK